ncbi:MAG: MJ0042-type zinc finger domain-containing protein [Candidatus Thorarchaeota archaeon]
MVYKVMIQSPDVEEVINLLKQKHGADYSRIWNIDGRTIGVFSFERSGPLTSSGYVNLITLDYDRSSQECEVTIIGAGGGMQSLISAAEIGDPGAEPIADLTRLAEDRGWLIDVTEAKIKSRGSECPTCHASYVYHDDKISTDGLVTCQNCGKSFKIHE